LDVLSFLGMTSLISLYTLRPSCSLIFGKRGGELLGGKATLVQLAAGAQKTGISLIVILKSLLAHPLPYCTSPQGLYLGTVPSRPGSA
jgi:hypothetical protein